MDTDPYEAERPRRFGLSINDIDTTLNDNYNTLPFRILPLGQFRDGVLQLLHESPDPVDFYNRLGELRDIKIKELDDLHGRIGCHVVGTRAFGPHDSLQKASQAALLFGHRSYSALIDFFMLYFPEIKDGPSFGKIITSRPATERDYLPPPAKVLRHDDVGMSLQTSSPPDSPPSIGRPSSVLDEAGPPELHQATSPRRSKRLAKKPTKVYNEKKAPYKVQKHRPSKKPASLKTVLRLAQL